MRIGFIGLGNMGNPMAQNLAAAGYNVTGYDVSPVSDAPFEMVDTAAQAAQDAEIVILMLPNGQIVRQVANDILPVMAAGSLLIDCSTVDVDAARDVASYAAAKHIHFVDAPVSGGTKGAEAGTLAIMVGGADADFERAKPVFEAMGRAVHVGPDGTGQLCKLANQAIVAATIGIVAEATLLAQKGGADPAALRAALQGGFADSTILQQHGERMSTHNFTPGGPAKFQLKDLNNTLEAADAENLHLPMTLEMRNRFHHLINAMDGGDLDHSALYLELLEQNNIQAD